MKKSNWKLEVGMHVDASAKIFEFARENRNNATKAESLLWEALKGHRLGGYKFRRQHPFGRFILDFYCHAKRLAVEIDGGYHQAMDQTLYDENRTAELSLLGVQEIRFKNEQVLNNFEDVLRKILETLESIEVSDKTLDP